MRSRYPSALRHRTWLALLSAQTLKEWQRLPTWDRERIGRARFGKFKQLAEQNRAAILEQENKVRGQFLQSKIDRDAIKAKREIHRMSIEALMRVEQRAHDAVKEILSPDPADFQIDETDPVRAFIAKCAYGFYDHRRRSPACAEYKLRVMARMAPE